MRLLNLAARSVDELGGERAVVDIQGIGDVGKILELEVDDPYARAADLFTLREEKASTKTADSV